MQDRGVPERTHSPENETGMEKLKRITGTFVHSLLGRNANPEDVAAATDAVEEYATTHPIPRGTGRKQWVAAALLYVASGLTSGSAPVHDYQDEASHKGQADNRYRSMPSRDSRYEDHLKVAISEAAHRAAGFFGATIAERADRDDGSMELRGAVVSEPMQIAYERDLTKRIKTAASRFLNEALASLPSEEATNPTTIKTASEAIYGAMIAQGERDLARFDMQLSRVAEHAPNFTDWSPQDIGRAREGRNRVQNALDILVRLSHLPSDTGEYDDASHMYSWAHGNARKPS